MVQHCFFIQAKVKAIRARHRTKWFNLLFFLVCCPFVVVVVAIVVVVVVGFIGQVFDSSTTTSNIALKLSTDSAEKAIKLRNFVPF